MEVQLIKQISFSEQRDNLKHIIQQCFDEDIDILVKQKTWDSISFTKWLRENFDSEFLKILYDKVQVIEGIGLSQKLKYKLKDAVLITD